MALPVTRAEVIALLERAGFVQVGDDVWVGDVAAKDVERDHVAERIAGELHQRAAEKAER